MRAKMAFVRAFLCQQVTVDRALFFLVHCIASLACRDFDLVDISLRLPPPMSAERKNKSKLNIVSMSIRRLTRRNAIIFNRTD